MWRRVAAGLPAGKQRQFSQDLRPALLPKKGGKIRISVQERTEMWMAVANMERLTLKDKIEFGRQLLSEFHPKKSRPPLFWSLSRIGARELLYGPVDRVVPAAETADWVDHLLEMPWKNPVPVGTALAQMGRKTGDRVRDLGPEITDRVIRWLIEHEMPEAAEFLKTVRPLQSVEQTTIFGESLPSGIILHDT